MKRIVLLPIFGIGFAILAAIPGALIGLLTGLFRFNLIAGILWGLIFFLVYPRFRRSSGRATDILTHLLALYGGIGGGLSCYFVGNLVH